MAIHYNEDRSGDDIVRALNRKYHTLQREMSPSDERTKIFLEGFSAAIKTAVNAFIPDFTVTEYDENMNVVSVLDTDDFIKDMEVSE